MTLPTTPHWEQNLLSLAREGLCFEGSILQPVSRASRPRNLSEAIKVCEAITAEYSRSFYLASQLLPAEKRQAMRVLYAFCRTADNLADGGNELPDLQLAELRKALTVASNHRDDPVLYAWSVINKGYGIPMAYAQQLLDGVERDLFPCRYPTFDELAVYCYKVASTVGLMSMHITGFLDRKAVPYAIKLGVALQLTNILRDVREDWEAGRVYLPLNELSAFGLGDSDLAEGRVDERWRNFMRFQIARARRLYAEALPGIELLHPDGRFAVAAAATLYESILDDIEAHDYDVFRRRSFANRKLKMKALLRAFLVSRGKLQKNLTTF